MAIRTSSFYTTSAEPTTSASTLAIVEKCKFMHYGKRSIEFEYSLCGHPLEAVASKKDLGVFFFNDLKVRRQCEEAYSKASQMQQNNTIQES